jgi:hypothetical protein
MIDSTSTLDELSQELVQGLPHDLRDPYGPDKPWTRAITDALCEMGTKRAFLACGRGCKHCGEWLLDIVWIGRKRHEIVLAVESEWGKPGDIEDDFDKLMSIKARHKLLIFATKVRDSAGMVKRLESLLLEYPHHIEGEEYMALNITAEGALRYRFQVPRNRQLDAVVFEEMVPPLRWPWETAS